MSRQGRGWSVLRGSILAVMAGLLGWQALALTGPRGYPALSGLGPQNPDLLFRQAIQQFVAQKGQVSPDLYERARLALLDRPLSEEPFALLGMRAVTSGRIPEGERLLNEARARNPRNRTALLGLTVLYLSSDRVRNASEIMKLLFAMNPQAEELLLPQLVTLARNPRNAPALVEVLGDKPVMARVLDQMVRRDAPTELVLRLSQRLPPPAPTWPDWQKRLLEREIGRGRVTGAYAIWQQIVRQERGGLVYDAQFSGRPGPAPFNWELIASGPGSAERGRPSGLEVEYLGRSSGYLARQLLMLAPGRYQLSFTAEGNAPGEGSTLGWRVACHGGGAPLVNVALRQVTYAPKRFEGAFTVPGGCQAQWLELVGSAAEFPVTQQARITDLAISPAGRP
ncbi:MAG TPA: hypothetical protein VGB54_15330 [Allosphingosinicella sp.]|jgi:hypothetical protein